jgi:NADH:ubiquinone oxidoreductase subunit 2 (subunit N)
MYLSLFTDFYVNEYNLSLVLFNIFVYLILVFLVFSIFFLFDLRFFKTLNEFKGFGGLSFVVYTLILSLMSFAGIPPLLGFVGKFLLFTYIFSHGNFVIFIIILFLNFFAIYFYFQNIRFLVSKSSEIYFNFTSFTATLDLPLIAFIVSLNIFNTLSIFFVADFLIFFSYWCSFLNIF